MSTQLHDAFIGRRARQRHDLIGSSETRTVGARSVSALWTLLLEYDCWEVDFVWVRFMCCEQSLTGECFVSPCVCVDSAAPDAAVVMRTYLNHTCTTDSWPVACLLNSAVFVLFRYLPGFFSSVRQTWQKNSVESVCYHMLLTTQHCKVSK